MFRWLPSQSFLVLRNIRTLSNLPRRVRLASFLCEDLESGESGKRFLEELFFSRLENSENLTGLFEETWFLPSSDK